MLNIHFFGALLFSIVNNPFEFALRHLADHAYRLTFKVRKSEFEVAFFKVERVREASCKPDFQSTMESNSILYDPFVFITLGL